jgi:DNA-binding response OmpR family regulator
MHFAEAKLTEKILVVDDKKEMRDLLSSYLSREGFDIVSAGDGREALFTARYEKPDLIILDIMMPQMDGYEFMRLYTREAATPIILLTAKLDETEKVLGLELGADDYITKPFSPRELSARVRAVLRRMKKADFEKDILRAAGITLDRAGRTVTVDEVFINLTPSEFNILAALVAAPGRAFTRMELLDHIGGGAFEGYERTIDVHIRNLRRKLNSHNGEIKYIETVYGTGYRFTPQRH